MGLLILGVGLVIVFVVVPFFITKLVLWAIADTLRRPVPWRPWGIAIFLLTAFLLWKHFQLPYAQTGAGEEAAIAAADQSQAQTRTEATGLPLGR